MFYYPLLDTAFYNAVLQNAKEDNTTLLYSRTLLDKLTETKGSVDEITVNGSTDYTKGGWMEPDTPIIVRYWK